MNANLITASKALLAAYRNLCMEANVDPCADLAKDLEDAISVASEPLKIVVTIEGGVLQGVLANSPVTLVSLDYDSEGAEAAEIAWIPQRESSADALGPIKDFESAVPGSWSAEVSPLRVAELIAVSERTGEAEPKFLVSVTYSKWSEEAVEAGEADETGMEIDGESCDLSELKAMVRKYGTNQLTSSAVDSGSYLASSNEADYETGVITDYNLFVKAEDGTALEITMLTEIFRAVGALS